MVYKIYLWDTAGQEKFKALIPSCIKDSKIVIIIYDITNNNSFKDVKEHYENILNTSKQITISLLGNKSDLNDKRVIKKEQGLNLSNELNIIFDEVSAKTGDNINNAFNRILKEYINKNTNDTEMNDNLLDNTNLDSYKIKKKKNVVNLIYKYL